MVKPVNITDVIYDRVAEVGNGRKLSKARMYEFLRVVARCTRNANRDTVTIADVTTAEHWCAEHGFPK